MKFDELDVQMRVYETCADQCIVPGMFIVARLDGRSFTRLTKDVLRFEAPFDERFRDLMLDTTEHLMASCGFRFLYGYTESDEISLLFPRNECSFQRKVRKLLSILAGAASARFSLGLGAVGCFDCRISQLPTENQVIDYFRWRNEDAHRNALNAHCYWLLRKQGASALHATSQLNGMSVAAKNELLFRNEVNFNELPLWQRRGCGLYWEVYDKRATDPRTHEPVTAQRRRLTKDLELPMKDAYSEFLRKRLSD